MNASPLVAHIEGPDGCEVLNNYADHQKGLLLCTHGSASYMLDTRQFEMQAGDMLIIAPFTYLTFTHLDADFNGILCMVDLEYIVSNIVPVNINANFRFVILHPLSHPSPTDTAAIISLITIIEQRSKFIGERPLAEMTTDHLVNALAYLVLDSYLNVSQTATKVSGTKESIMINFHSDLARDFTLHRKVSHYAELQNLTPRYFSTTIKTISGFTPLYWINTAVAAEARRLMRDSKMSIKEIAYTLNFASPTFFTRWYREYTGETPSQYRSRCRIAISPKP